MDKGNFSESQIGQWLLTHFGIQGNLKKLPGEVDLNYKVKTETGSYIFKISRQDIDLPSLEFQSALLEHLEKTDQSLIAPRIIRDKNNQQVCVIYTDDGERLALRVLSWISGRIYHDVKPKSSDLRYSIGLTCGRQLAALTSFDHPGARRDYAWDVAQSLWTKEHLDLFEGEQRSLVNTFIEAFESFQEAYSSLRKAVVHNDANDYNLVVSHDPKDPEILAAIDYGDALYTQVINDVAISCAYAMMDVENPLEAALDVLGGYHESFGLKENELSYLHACIGMRLVISVTKSAINKQLYPENTYLQISEKPAWDLLSKWAQVSEDFAHYSFRKACGLSAHPSTEKFYSWVTNQKNTIADLFPATGKSKVHSIDLSVGSTWLGHPEVYSDPLVFEYRMRSMERDKPDSIAAGGYLEPRMIYTTAAYRRQGNNGPESRTVHLGVDYWLPPGTAVHALYDGEVVVAVNDEGDKEYGGLIILKHQEDGLTFYSLHGHMSVASALAKRPGELIRKGDLVGHLGVYEENGNWAPHLHFQLMLSLLGFENDFPGVAFPSELGVWKDLCPNPDSLFAESQLAQGTNNSTALIDYRSTHLGKSLSLSYQQPLHIVRGYGAYLFDQSGQAYLDTVNNVAHVGHENYQVVKAGQEQMAVLNTNTRYLHKNINQAAEKLLATVDPKLSVVHFVNSGSEANELALRMVKAVTGSEQIIASEVGYHGNSNACISISSYKFDGKGGKGCPEGTHIFPLPDAFRGKYRGPGAGAHYAEEIDGILGQLNTNKQQPGALIVEPIISCGGQIDLPEGFLKRAYASVRAAGGLCISDEVQVGCGRVGDSFWGHQLHGVVPDIMTIGKPLGNGHPVAAVICTAEVAEKFANGMEYFNTFGGNPVSTAIAASVLDYIDTAQLQEHAKEMGAYLKTNLRNLAKMHPIIGDVRGSGLFLGFELVDDELNPLADQADHLINRMKEKKVLMSTDGPDHNVIKIKPPMVISKEDIDYILDGLNQVLSDDFMQL